MAVQIIGGTTGDILSIDPSSKAARATLYGSNGQLVTPPDASAVVPGTTPGAMAMGADYKIARLMRVASDGMQRTTSDSLMLYDQVEGAAVNTNKWISTVSTQTITQATGVITFNSGSSVAATTGAMLVSHRLFPLPMRQALLFRTRLRLTQHYVNHQAQFGFGNPTAVTAAAIVNGAFWRKDGTGQLIPVICINSSENLGTPISDATFRSSVAATDYAIFEVLLEDTRATFSIYTSVGALVHRQTVNFTELSAAFSATHLAAFHHSVNTGATGTATQMLVSGVAVYALDVMNTRPWQSAVVGQQDTPLVSPTTFLQLANYANSIAPVSATLSNTAGGYAATVLGGQWQFAAPGGAETDFILFGYTVPAPYSLYIQRVRITAFNMGAAVATTPTLLQWGLAFNSSAISLATAAPYAPMRRTIGSQYIPVGGVVGQMFTPDTVVWEGLECVQSARFFHVIVKVPVGTATGSQIIRGTCTVDGYFE